MEKRLEWIDTLKGISIILVVYYHAVLLPYSIPFKLNIFERTLFDSANYFFIYNLAPLRMPLFFMISGFLVNSSVCNKSWKAVSHSRIGTYIYVFCLWAIIQNLLVGLMGGSDSSSDSLVSNSIYAISVSDFLSSAVKGVSSLWYLYALVIFFILTKLCKFSSITLIFLAFLLSIYSTLEPISFPYNGMLYCYLFFVIGVFWGKAFFTGIENFSLLKNMVILSMGVGIIVLGRYYDLKFKLLESFFAIYIVTLITINLFKIGFPLQIVSYIGRNTLPIYIIHRPLIEFFMLFAVPWVLEFSISSTNNHMLFSVLTPITITVFCIVFSIVFWKLTNFSFGRYLYGYKFSSNGS
ncbi:acyltransferase family protein [uncultured Alteromonas sp.]|uniref:acyltransferase family protein n=1 Tax=uncultured Alteromonas sp. TaxID=179113 RepID=UPI0030D7F3D4